MRLQTITYARALPVPFPNAVRTLDFEQALLLN
jgi:hypothetical protein